jgi:hypothetical protein
VIPPDRREVAGAAALVVVGVGLRLIFVAIFPTLPVSDFGGLVLFGVRLAQEGLAVPGWHWVQFNAGMPLILSVLFRLAPHGVAATARTATAVVTGLVALLPYAIWRPVLARRWRLLAGLMLALWPGLVFFSGVASQENWVLPPVVALACLAVRRLRDPDDAGHPLSAGLLFFAAVAIRQEMLVVMAAPALAAAGFPGRPDGRWGRLARTVAAAGLGLAALAAQRYAATGRFAITTEHGAVTLLGTLAPGSAAAGWVQPTLFVAATEAGAVRDPAAYRQACRRLAWAEWKRRYHFHLFRSAVAVVRLGVESDAQNLFWSLDAPGALPPGRAAAGASFARLARPCLRVELSLLSGLFVAALALGLARRDPAILVPSAAVVARLAVALVFAPLGRLMIPVIALELVVVALAAARISTAAERVRFGGLALAAAALALALAAPLEGLAVRKDEAAPTLSRFPLVVAGRLQWAECSTLRGRVTAYTGDRVWLGAGPGAAARVSCRVPAPAAGAALAMDLDDTGAPRVRIEVDGREIPERRPLPGGIWTRVPLTGVDATKPFVLTVDIPREESPVSVGWGLVDATPGARVLPRHRELP